MDYLKLTGSSMSSVKSGRGKLLPRLSIVFENQKQISKTFYNSKSKNFHDFEEEKKMEKHRIGSRLEENE